ncbi:SET domain-containing protein 5 [Pleosporales sp. CAS-2024a]
MRETPPIKIAPPNFVKGTGYPMKEITELVRAQFDKLSPAQQEEVMSLTYHATPAEVQVEAEMYKLGAIFRTNAYNSGTDIGLFPKIARINHSCRPNASYYWSEQLNKRIRQAHLDRYEFKCTCEACAQEEAAQTTSDERRTIIGKALLNFESQLTLEPPEGFKAKQRARESAKISLYLAELLQQEGLADYYSKAYRIVAICHARIEDWEPAAIWANKGYEWKYLEDPDSIYTQEMHNLTGNFILNWQEHLKKKAGQKAR